MQNAKDTFYVVVQARLAAANPARTMVLRGVVRPGIWVEENELATAYEPTDGFCLSWTSLRVDASSALPLVTMVCEIRYVTDGSAGNGGMDRGRLMGGMDAALAAVVNAAPQNALKMNYAGSGLGVAAVAMGTNVFWGDVVFGEVKVEGERLERVATVAVFAYQEAGEL
jgi:hypothetical protein